MGRLFGVFALSVDEKNHPRGFSLSNYAQVLNFSARDWYLQLDLRRELLNEAEEYKHYRIYLETNDDNEEYGAGNDYYDSIRSEIEEHLANPIDKIDTYPFNPDASGLSFLKGDCAANLAARIDADHPLADYPRGVRPISVSDIYRAEGNLQPEYQVYARQHYGQPYCGDEKLRVESEYPPLPWLYERASRYMAGTPRGIETVRIDLALSNKVLQKQFNEFLKQARRDHPQFPSRQSPMFSELHTIGVLPYLDLRIWMLMSGKELTNPEIAELIYDMREASTGQRVLEVTKPKADRLISKAFLDELLSHF
jgi:hypothetical protein